MSRDSARGRRPVLHDHDGSVDDLLSLLLLTRYESVDLRGVSVIPADCLLAPAVSASRKILDLTGLPHVPVAGGDLPGRNPFPMEWRVDALRVDALPQLNRVPRPAGSSEARRPVRALPAHRQLAAWLLDAPEPVTLLATAPLTNLAWCLEHRPEVAGNVRELVFMGGAVDVEGNVDQPGHDGTAEWNIYWDPDAAHRVFSSGIPITLFPLDVTNQVPVSKEWNELFGLHAGDCAGNSVADLAGTLLAMTHGTRELTGLPYCCWDSLSASYLAEPDLCTFTEIRCDIVTSGRSQGRLVRDPAARPIRCATSVDAERFYAHCVDTLT